MFVFGVKYQNHIAYFHSVHTLVSDGFTVINCPVCSGGKHKNVQNTDFDDPKIESAGFP